MLAESYKRSPKLTVFSVFFIITLIVGGVTAAEYLKESDFKNRAPESIALQLDELDKFDEGLKNLTAFVQLQKEQLTEQQKVISELEKKRSELEPIVESQTEVVEAIFRVQEQREQRGKWFDIGLGFVLGIIGSLISSVIFKLIEKRRKNA
ncbi:hypothetical protein HPY09_15850 [Vibrio cholerae]|uniref:Uncharacterized protein n=2 Tax=Vibrionaceae TaxID=641 RepID=A0A0C1ZBI1_9VIBR|nr:hypothetical protein H735_03470 [Vibrio owensii CAIM 1854 = LMG 25443]QKU73075.1 hypothetical protein HPY09_15850 [Vibrio cholerae]QKU77030.1 hypothetical protein HPY05_15855 [Vibrio cholerae]